MNQKVSGIRKLFSREVSKASIGKVESCGRIKDGNGRLALGEDQYSRIILRIFIIWITRNMVHSTRMSLVVFMEVTTSERN